MASIVVSGDTSGTVTLAAPAVSGTTTLTLPTTTGNVVADTATQTLTNKTLTSPTIATPTITGQATIPTINLTGGQITFPATQSASANANTLDDYEEGTWTPVVTGSSTNPTITYNLQAGTYTKIGNLVNVSIQLGMTRTGGTGNWQVSLPFTAAAGNYYAGSIGAVSQFTHGASLIQWGCRIGPSAAVGELWEFGTAINDQNVPVTAQATGQSYITLAFAYYIA